MPIWRLATGGSRGWALVSTLLANIILTGGGYLVVLHIAEWRGVSRWDSTTRIDLWVPAIPWTLVVYATFYPYFLITLLLAPRGLRGVQALLYHLQAQLLISLITWAAFLLLPTKIHVREQMEPALTSSGEFMQAVYSRLYMLDAPWNAWPSLHVSLSLLMLLCSAHFTLLKVDRHKLWPSGRLDTLAIAIAVPCWLLMCLSILTTKQHFFFDIWTGALAGWLTWHFYLRKLLSNCAGTVAG